MEWGKKGRKVKRKKVKTKTKQVAVCAISEIGKWFELN